MVHLHERTPGAAERLAALHGALVELRQGCLDAEAEFADLLGAVRPIHRNGARNLVHYIAFRRHDLRSVQEDLARFGLSSLGRCESHVLSTLDTVIDVLGRLRGPGASTWVQPVVDLSEAHLELNSERLLGPAPLDRPTRIMVTLPSDAATDEDSVVALVDAGMDVARINCAHDDEGAWRAMAANVRAGSVAGDRPVRVAMDLCGPKLRTGPLPARPPVVRVSPQRDERGVVVEPVYVWLRGHVGSDTPSGAVALDVAEQAWLRECRSGDVVRLRDTRGALRQLTVLEAHDGGVLLELTKTVYLEPGTPLELRIDGVPMLTTITSVPAKEPSIVLHMDDELLLVGPGDPRAAVAGDLPVVSCTLPEVITQAEAGQRVWFDDGKIGALVTASHDDALELRVVDVRPGGARLRSGKGINLPDTDLAIPALDEADEAALAVAAEIADMVDVSFVRGPADVAVVQDRLREHGAEHLGLVLKIETVPGFRNLPEILLTAMQWDGIGVMIARGDLAVEAGFGRMAELQEEILWICEAAHVPVVWATQVLDQLARTGRASRAEITDAALSARAECIMLNKGPHIVSAITTLAEVHRRMNDHQHKKQSLLRRLHAWDPAPTE
jgi:pyruvate kinase